MAKAAALPRQNGGGRRAAGDHDNPRLQRHRGRAVVSARSRGARPRGSAVRGLVRAASAAFDDRSEVAGDVGRRGTVRARRGDGRGACGGEGCGGGCCEGCCEDMGDGGEGCGGGCCEGCCEDMGDGGCGVGDGGGFGVGDGGGCGECCGGGCGGGCAHSTGRTAARGVRGDGGKSMSPPLQDLVRFLAELIVAELQDTPPAQEGADG